MLLFLLLVTFVSYFSLLKGVKFVTFFTACNFDKLFFTIEKGQGNCFISYGKGCALIYFFFNSFTIEGEGGFKFMFYFSPSFDMWKEEGKGPCFFLNFFFHC